MILAPFELHRPTNLSELFALVRDFGDDFDFIAGGTDLLQNYKNRLNLKSHLIGLDRVEELVGVEESRIGAMERLNRVADQPVIRERYPGLVEAIRVVASPLIRNSGTIGGNLLVENRCYYFNQTPWWRGTKGSCMKAESDICLVVPQKEICYAAYSGDLAPVLMTMGAEIDLVSPSGERRLALTDFYRGDGIERNVRQPQELIRSILLPEDASTLNVGYEKLRIRDTLDYPEMGIAVAVRIRDGQVDLLRCATTAVDVVPQYRDFSQEVVGKPLEEVIEHVASEMSDQAKPMKNTSMPVGYRKKMVRVFGRRLLTRLSEGNRTE